MNDCNGHDCQHADPEQHSAECIAEHQCSYTGIEPIEVVTYFATMLGLTTEQMVKWAANGKAKTAKLAGAAPHIADRTGMRWWDVVCAMPRYSFWRGEQGDGIVNRVPDPTGNWVEVSVVEAMVGAIDIAFRQTEPSCTDERPCVNCFSGQGECEVGPFGGPELLEQARALCQAIERLPAGEHQTNLISKIADATFALQNLQSTGDYFWPRPMAPELTQAAQSVLAERRRQVEVEGWTPEHDDQYAGGQMAFAAIAYLMVGVNPNGAAQWWPWDAKTFKPSPDTRRNLVKAGALLLADIEWVDRRQAAATTAPDDLTQFLEQTDFEAAEKVASEKADAPALPTGGEDDCEGCKI